MMKQTIYALIAALAVVGLAGNGYTFDIGQGLGFTAPQAPAAPVAAPAPFTQPQIIDYAANQKSDVFGANLFTGAFARQGATHFNPDYVVAGGDKIQVSFWGAFEYDAQLTVDPKGNIFLPHVGPVQVMGVRNQDVQRVINAAVATVYRTNVNSYASLASAQPVRVFVGGYVNRPGLYSGTSLDSILNYLDQAGGIDPERGSFLNVQVKRGEEVRATANLYGFLLDGNMPSIQFADGDVIFVNQRQNTVNVTGLAESVKRFEFSNEARTVADIVRIAKPLARATHVRVVRNTGAVKNVEYYPIEDAARVALQNGDELDFTADKKNGTITVRVEGEHLNAQEYVLQSGARYGELIKQIKFSERSDSANIQLFRQSVRDRQRAMFATALKSLESSVLTARSATSDEAVLRKEEAELILKWIDRAKTIQPSGQVVIATSSVRDELLLENGDLINIPAKDGLVLINGEVLFPATLLFDANNSVESYIKRAGGFTQNANTSRIVIAHRDGSFDEVRSGAWFGGNPVRSGDEILVLPKIDVKSIQIVKDLTQILFQIAVSTKVIVGL